MKSSFFCLLCIILFLPVAAIADATESQSVHELVALMSFGGTQNGGDEAAFIDTAGGVYYIDLEGEGLYWYADKILPLLQTLPDSYKIAELSADEMAQIQELIAGISETKAVIYGISACDAGVFRQIVYRAADDGENEEITLLTAGDTVSENIDSNAIRLSCILLNTVKQSRYLHRWSFLFPYSDAVPVTFSYARGSYFGGTRDYSLRRIGDHVLFSAQGTNGDETDICVELDDAEGFFSGTGIMSELQQILIDEGIPAWDGFDEHNDSILDGYGFTLKIDYATSTVNASGYEKYPERYTAASSALEAFFGKLMLRVRAIKTSSH